MDPKNDEDRVGERDASLEDARTVSEPHLEFSGSFNSIRDNNQEETECDTISMDSSLSLNTSSGSSTTLECGAVQDCLISIPENVYRHPDLDNVIGSRRPEFCKDSVLKTGDLIPLGDRSTRYVLGRSDVALNLDEFLFYAQGNNFNIVIPASRENPTSSTNLSRTGTGRACMMLEQAHFPRDFSFPASTAQYPPADFINVSNVTSRNSVLAPNMYYSGEDIQPPVVDFNAPPPYEIKLPSYEEVQREKALEGELVSFDINSPNANASSSRTLSFLTIDSDTNADPESKLLGTDCMFMISFFLALALNWIGFLLLMCFCHTVASRYGALSGFGLSLVKWSIIVRNSDVSVNAWLWWFVTAFGMTICVKALWQYIYVKRRWRTLSQAAQERHLFLY